MSRRSRPIIVPADGGGSVQLDRVGFGKEAGYDEHWLQRLVHRHPNTLPLDEIEPGLGQFYSVCMELPISTGFVDNLLVSPEGVLAVIETKLWRNPEARRKVIAQALDYASTLFAMDYESLQAAVHGAAVVDGLKPGRIIDCISDGETPDEAEFIDAINTNLRRGRMIVLVAGDGIRSELSNLADTLQSHAGVRFTFGLVEMSVYRLPDGQHMVHPSTLVKTEMVERGVVRIEDGKIQIAPERAEAATSSRPATISSESFFDDMAKLEITLPAKLDRFLEGLRSLGVEPEFKKSLILRYTSPEGKAHNLGYIMRNGEIWTDRLDDAAKVSHDVVRPHIERLALLFGGRVDESGWQNTYWYVRIGKDVPKITTVADKLPGWLEEIRTLIQAIRAEETAPGDGAAVYCGEWGQNPTPLLTEFKRN